MQTKTESKNAIPLGWTSFCAYAQNDFEFGSEKIEPFEGCYSGFVTSATESNTRFGTLIQTVQATAFIGNYVTLIGLAKVDKSETESEMWMEINDEFARLIEKKSLNIISSQEWSRFALTLFVPESAVSICFGGMLRGAGKLWFRSIEFNCEKNELPPEPYQVSAYDPVVQETPPPPLMAPKNLNYKTISGGLPEFWDFTGRYTAEFKTKFSHEADERENTLTLTCQNPERNYAAGAVLQTFSACNFHGQLIEFSAFVKSMAVAEKCGLFLRVNGPTRLLDDMDDRPVTGTTDWKSYELQFRVPQDAHSISIGVNLQGSGEISVKQMKFSLSETDKPVSSNRLSQPSWPLEPVNLSLADT